MKLSDEDKMKQRVTDILAKWEQLLLNDFSGGGWARTSPELCDSSLVYVSQSKFRGESYVSAQWPVLILHSLKQNCEYLQMRD